jgi:uncharacterized repeat protein (TIGR01451 family)
VCAGSAFFPRNDHAEEFVKVCRIAGHLWSGRIFLAIGLIVGAGALVLIRGFAVSTAAKPAIVANHGAGTQANAVRTVGQVPLSFEPNRGQTDSRVKFLARGAGYGLFLTSDEAVLKLQTRSGANGSISTEEVAMKLVGTSSASVAGAEELAAKSNYIIGRDRSKWRTGIPQYARVRYDQVYPGIDLVYYGHEGQLEYDFNVAPGADPQAIQLSFAGERNMAIDRKGNLVVRAAGGDLVFHAPIAYQDGDGGRRNVASHFVLSAGNRVSFAVGEYDRRRGLVIDPTLSFSRYLGGTGSEVCIGATRPGCPAIAVDQALNYYVAGSPDSTAFPGVGTGAFQTGLAAGATANVFISKFDAANTLISSTYLGGDGTDTTAGVAADGAGNIYVAGTTTSTNFPTLNGFNPGPASGTHTFVSVLKPDLTGLVYSTYVAGGGSDTATGLAIDGKGNAFFTGITTSTDLPTTATALQRAALSATDSQFFMGKLDTTATGATSLKYLTYFGGGNPASGAIVQGGGIAVDSSGNAYITGGTNFLHLGNTASDFPVLNASQDCLGTPAVVPVPNPLPPCVAATAPDAFVAKINPNAIGTASLLYSTYLGGGGSDIGYGIAVDSGSNVYVTGSTTSNNFYQPSSNPFQLTPGGGGDAFLAKLNNPAAGAAVTPTYFTYIGFGGTDLGSAVAVDSSGNARVTGWTTGGFPVGGLGGGGGTDAFLARIDTSGSTTAVNFASLLGGSGTDHGTGVALDPNFFTYVVGDTTSGNFPTVPAQSGPSGASDAFVSKLEPVSDLTLTAGTPSAAAVGVGNPVTFKYTVKNAGPDPTGGITFIDNLPTSGASFGSITTSPGTCSAPSGSTVQCSIGTLAGNGTATVSVTMTPTTATASFSNSATVAASPLFSIDPQPGNNTAGTSVQVQDFSLGVSPQAQTTVAGQQPPVQYEVTVTPLPKYPNPVSLSCSSGLPSGASCSFSTTSVTLPNTSPASSTLKISTTARPVTTTSLRPRSGLFYAMLLPISGFALIGVGVGTSSRRRKWLLGMCLVTVLGTMMFQAACGGSNSSTPPVTGGTPAGSYTITVTGTSGSVSRQQTVTLTVQ